MRKHTDTKDSILSFADQLAKRPLKRRHVVVPVIRPRDLHVPFERAKDLIPIKDAVSRGLMGGAIAVLNRKASAGEIKAIKIPGRRGWLMLPEWIEEFNNGWAKSFREKVRA